VVGLGVGLEVVGKDVIGRSVGLDETGLGVGLSVGLRMHCPLEKSVFHI
jgi:hypothetical protein